MGRFLFGVAGVLLIGFMLLMPTTASAQEFNHTITVYAVVPEQRAVYIDSAGNIIKIAGNTAKNIPPQVYDSAKHLITMTVAVQDQYDDFLIHHGNHLEAGKIYKINPLHVNNSSNNQSITLVAPRQLLTLDFK